MCKRICLLLWISAGLLCGAAKPKLVLAITIDQFRYDYLTRFRSEYHGGLDRLLTKGAVFTNARYEHFPTVTAVGHSTIMSGATPSVSGIISNEWFDRGENRTVSSVFDDQTKLLGGKPGPGSSPARLLVSTVGDELKIANKSKSKVIGISLKDRSAILPAGHMANGCYWFDNTTGNFVSSTYYFEDLPGWVKDFNSGRNADRFQGMQFGKKVMPAAGEKLYQAIVPTPFGNELMESFIERAIAAEQLGQHEAPDVLAVSFSSNDYVGHDLGPDSDEMHEITVYADKLLDKFFAYVDRSVGLDNVIVVLTADHGVAPVPEVNIERKMPGGRISVQYVKEKVQAGLARKYGAGKWIVGNADLALYLNIDLMAEKNLDRAEVNKTAEQICLAIPHVFRVYTREEIQSGRVLGDSVDRRVLNSYYARRSPDIEMLLEPYWMSAETGTTHGTTFGYDTHVPVIFMGPGVKAGRYYASVAVNDIATTLATMLDVEIPSGSVGRVLSEMLAE
jgi:hypothetical protein